MLRKISRDSQHVSEIFHLINISRAIDLGETDVTIIQRGTKILTLFSLSHFVAAVVRLKKKEKRKITLY